MHYNVKKQMNTNLLSTSSKDSQGWETVLGPSVDKQTCNYEKH